MIHIRLEYALEGSSNFIAWKDRMEVALDDNGFLEYIKIDVAKPQAFDAHNLAQWKKYVAKARRYLREFENTLSQISMGKKLLSQCGRK